MSLKKYLLLLFLSGLAAFFAAKAVSAYWKSAKRTSPSEADTLSFDPPAIDFGTVDQLSTQTAVFEVTNHHARPIRIDEVLKGCSCAKAEIAKKILAAGEKTALTVEWSVGRRRGNSHEAIIVHYTIPEQNSAIRFVQTSLYCKVTPDYYVKPAIIDMSAEGETRAELTVHSTRGGIVPDINSVRFERNVNATIDNITKTIKLVIPAIKSKPFNTEPQLTIILNSEPLDSIPVELITQR